MAPDSAEEEKAPQDRVAQRREAGLNLQLGTWASNPSTRQALQRWSADTAATLRQKGGSRGMQQLGHALAVPCGAVAVPLAAGADGGALAVPFADAPYRPDASAPAGDNSCQMRTPASASVCLPRCHELDRLPVMPRVEQAGQICLRLQCILTRLLQPCHIPAVPKRATKLRWRNVPPSSRWKTSTGCIWTSTSTIGGRRHTQA